MIVFGVFAVGLIAFFVLCPLACPGREPCRSGWRNSSRWPSPTDVKIAGGAALPDRVFDDAEERLEGSACGGASSRRSSSADIRMKPAHIAIWTFVATLFAMWFLALVFTFVGAAPRLLRPVRGLGGTSGGKVERKRALFAEQLPDNLAVLASAIRAGHSFVGALSVVVDDAPEPARREFRRVVADEQLGRPLEDALDLVVVRMKKRRPRSRSRSSRLFSGRPAAARPRCSTRRRDGA